jgi:predicted nucleotidyltransferase
MTQTKKSLGSHSFPVFERDVDAHPIARWRLRYKYGLLSEVLRHAQSGDTLLPPRIFLFGSFASGRWNDLSDVDLIYVWRNALARDRFWDRRLPLELWLVRHGFYRRVDVIDSILTNSRSRAVASLRAHGDAIVYLPAALAEARRRLAAN